MTRTAPNEDTNGRASGGGDVGGDRREDVDVAIDDKGPSSSTCNADQDQDDVDSSDCEGCCAVTASNAADSSHWCKGVNDPLPVCHPSELTAQGVGDISNSSSSQPPPTDQHSPPSGAVVTQDRGEFSPPQCAQASETVADTLPTSGFTPTSRRVSQDGSGRSRSTPGAHAIPGITSLRRQEAHGSAGSVIPRDPRVDLGGDGDQEAANAEAVDTITAVLVQEPIAVRAEELVVTDNDDTFDENDGESRHQEQEKSESQCKRMKRMQLATVASILLALVAIIVLPIVITRRDKTEAPTRSPKPTTSPTFSPSTAPPTVPPTSTEFRRQNLLDIVSVVSDPYAFQDVSSPQYRALDWLQYDDGARVPLSETERIVQRYILAVFYYSTGGSEGHWTNDYDFLMGSHECEWTDGTSGVDGCSNDLAVTSMDFSSNGLVGRIPTELAELTHLQEFRLMDNANLTGPIPSEFGRLTDLSFLSLVNNDLSGTIPSTLGNFNKMMGLWLHRNNLVGTIPPEFGLGLSSIKWLWLHENSLTGETPQSFANLTTATHIWLYGNDLTGSVDFLCDSLVNLEELSVDRDEVRCKCCLCCD